MKRFVLIACSSKKRPDKSKAKDLYDSTLFHYSYKYALILKPSKMFILSAKYGLLNPNKKIEPYKVTLNNMPAKEIRKWAYGVLKNLGRVSNLDRDLFIFLAGEKYRKYLIPHMRYYEVPLAGMPIGKQLQYLKNQTS